MRKTSEHSRDVANKVTVNVDTLADMLDCGRVTAARIGKDAGARVQIGKRVLYSVEKINAYLNGIAENACV